ncbi:MAG TPA: hypothetical protein VNN08_12430 [Thermoanaerobaculia bacterium]|nr:hypothetical protein [Thermoanaerobaculia bacterium]
MKIHFQGLIVHAEIDLDERTKRQLAVLMALPHHSPLLSINATDFRADQSDPADGASGDGTVVCFGLDGKVTSSAGWGTAANTPRAIPQVRVLKRGGGDIDAAVLNRTKHADKFFAFVELADGGTYSVKDFYVQNVTFQSVGFGCLARTTTYTFDAQEYVAFTIEGTGKHAVVAPEAEVYITNLAKVDHPHTTSHYDAYRQFFDPPATSILSPAEDSIPCPFGSIPPARTTCTAQADILVDCSNTRFP